MTKKKIVLIGATGKVGSKVAELLLSQNTELTLIARTKEKLLPFQAKGAKIVAASVLEVEQLIAALTGADAVLTMIASNGLAPDFLADQLQQADAQIKAIQQSGIKYVVNLSSNGCQVKEGNGVIQGLSVMEEKLNALNNIKVLHLRPTFYMENIFYALDLIKYKGIYGLPISGDKTFPMIATKDVAQVIAEKLLKLDFAGKSILPLLGPKDYSLTELANAAGDAIDKKPLPYIQFPVADFIGGIVSTGASVDFANRFTELMVATDHGILNTHQRTAINTTPTTVEEFAATVFAPAYLHN